jgi:hypothetical protein
MPAERDLAVLLSSMEPVQKPGAFVFVTLDPDAPVPPGAQATVVEEEGLTVVLAQPTADALGLGYDFVAAWITLQVHSALDAVGLTAAVSARLAEHGISCNVLAGTHHDHLLVPQERTDDALAALRELAD